MQKLKFSILCCSLLSVACIVQAQEIPNNWFLLDAKKDGYNGLSLEKTYEFLKGKRSSTVVVAILDSGVDAEHEDLSANMWVNIDEIPDNGIDDDRNGYIDDIHGWNFIGGKDGKNVHHDSYEVTRIYSKLRYKYENADPDKIAKHQKDEYALFLKVKKDVDGRRKSATANLENIANNESSILSGMDKLAAVMGAKELTVEHLQEYDNHSDKDVARAAGIIQNIQDGSLKTFQDVKNQISKEFEGAKKHFSNELNFAFNPDYDTRDIVGDDPTNINERYYGNNDVEGPDAFHGTHVAGVIGAVRNNNTGIEGIANNVKIMSVRCVPDGDERDKDVANSIRYAVDNGAHIINMSFGKGNSPNKQLVDDAVKYALEKDVLLVHAAGNAASNNDDVANFPNDKYEKRKFLAPKTASNWLEVGALSHKKAPELLAGFSNYGKKNVDVFSPGTVIYSTIPNNNYENAQGTSMASPICAGIATLIRSYYPTLTSKQVKNIIMESTITSEEEIKIPGTKKMGKLKDISVTGGMVNAEKAIMLAAKTKGKKKLKGWPAKGGLIEDNIRS